MQVSGGSSSLLTLLASEADERSVRRGELAPAIERNYQSAHAGSLQQQQMT